MFFGIQFEHRLSWSKLGYSMTYKTLIAFGV